MSTTDWLTPEDVALYLDEVDPTDDNLVLSTAAVKAAVERRRSDLWLGDPAAFTPGEDVRAGSIIWAALVFQARSRLAASGDVYEPLGAPRPDIMRLIGWRRPVAQ